MAHSRDKDAVKKDAKDTAEALHSVEASHWEELPTLGRTSHIWCYPWSLPTTLNASKTPSSNPQQAPAPEADSSLSSVSKPGC